MSRNYSNVDKRKWTDKYAHEHHGYDKDNAGYVKTSSFPQYSLCHLCHVQMYKVL